MDTPLALPEISFQEWKYLDAHLIWIYEGAPRAAGKNIGESQHVTAWYLLAGQVEVFTGGEGTVAKKGDWVFLPPGKSLRHFSEDARILSLHFNVHWVTGQQLFNFKNILVMDSKLTCGWLNLCRPMLQLVRQSYPDAYNQLPAAGATFEQYTMLQGNFLHWLGAVLMALQKFGVDVYLPQTCDSRVLGMMRWIDALPIQAPFRMSNMVEAIGLSSAQINRLFCAEFGMTPKRSFERRRLKFADAALLSSSQAVKEISYQLGFRHQSEFTAWFKKHTGKSPSEFRNTSM
jgi:AraC-like DNA-binding protein